MADEPLNIQESKLLLDTDNANTGNDSSNAETRFLYLSCLVVAFGFFTLGYDLGSISGSMVFISDYFSLTYLWHELLVSLAIGPAIVGALFSGYSNEIFGRKLTLLVSAVIFIAGSLVMACAFSANMLLLGRILTGISFGFMNVSSNMYIAEFAPARIRGRLISYGSTFVAGALFSAALISGIFSEDKINGWRYMLGLGAVPALFLCFGILLVPESPRWLISKGREKAAVKVLQKLRGLEDVYDEIYEIKHHHKLAKQEGSSWNILFRILQVPNTRRALLIACGLMAFQQLSGINTILYYVATIIQMSGVKNKSTAVWLGVAAAFTSFIFTSITIFTVERLGRRKLLLTTTAGVFLALVMLGITFHFDAQHSPVVTKVINSRHSCFGMSSCNECLYNQMCGFCYFERVGTVQNASCVPLESYSSTTSLYCSPDFKLLRYYGCPSTTVINALAVIGLVLYLACFAPGLASIPCCYF